MSSAASFLDPANFLNMNKKRQGISISGIMDPIGNTVQDVTGKELPFRSNIRKYIDVPRDPEETLAASPHPTVVAAAKRIAEAKKAKLSRYRGLRTKGSIMTTKEDTLG